MWRRLHSRAFAGQTAGVLGRVDRYLLRHVLPPFFFAVLLVCVAVFMFQLRRLASAAFGLGMRPQDIPLIFVAALPKFLIIAVPIAYLGSVLVGLGRLASDLEIVGFRSVGLSPARIARAPLVAGALIAILATPIAYYGEPYGLNLLFDRLVDVGLRNLASAVEPGVFNEHFEGVAFYAESVERNGELGDVLLFDQRGERPMLIVAEQGKLTPSFPPGGEPTLSVALLKGEIHFGRGRGPKSYERARFDRLSLGINASGDIQYRTRFLPTAERRWSGQILEEAAIRGPNDRWARRLMKTYYRRFSFPLMALVFGFMGVAIALSGGAQAHVRNALYAMVIVVIYYLLTRVGDVLAERFAHTELIAAFGPNLIVLGFAFILLKKAEAPR